jgi:hypothetical protein
MPSQEGSAAYLTEDRGEPALIAMYIVTALSTIVVLVRLYARGLLIRELGMDDYLIVFGQVNLLSFFYCLFNCSYVLLL